MQYPDNSMTGSGGLHITTTKREDGQWEASTTFPGVQPVVAERENEAIQAMKAALWHAVKTSGR